MLAFLDKPPREIMPVANMIHGLVLRLTAIASATTALACIGYYGYAAVPLLAALAIMGRQSLYLCFHFPWFRRWLVLQALCAIVLTAWAMHLAFAGSSWWLGVLASLLWAEGVGHYLNAENVRSFARTYRVPRELGDEDPD